MPLPVFFCIVKGRFWLFRAILPEIEKMHFGKVSEIICMTEPLYTVHCTAVCICIFNAVIIYFYTDVWKSNSCNKNDLVLLVEVC